MTAPLRTAQDHLACWPFHWLSLYADMAQDVGRYARTLSECTDAMEAIRAEGVLALRLWDDLARAYADLAATSWSLMAGSLAQQAADIRTAEIRPLPARAVSSARRGQAAR